MPHTNNLHGQKRGEDLKAAPPPKYDKNSFTSGPSLTSVCKWSLNNRNYQTRNFGWWGQPIVYYFVFFSTLQPMCWLLLTYPRCWSESGLRLRLNGGVRVRVQTRIRTRTDSTLVDSDFDSNSTSVDSDSRAVDSDSGLIDSDSDSTQVDSDSQWAQVSPVRNVQGKFKLSCAIMDKKKEGIK